VPSEDWKLLFRWTNQVIGKDDPEFRQPGETPGQTIRRARGELHNYLTAIIERRRREPATTSSASCSHRRSTDSR